MRCRPSNALVDVLLGLAVAVLALAAPAADNAASCHSPLGAYYLPRALLQLKVHVGDKEGNTEIDVTTVMVADRTRTLCLDFLAPLMSQDIVTVKRDAKGLLSIITSKDIDKASGIAHALSAVGENRERRIDRGTEFTAWVGSGADVTFDPFKWSELELANQALRRFGFCVYVEGYSFPKLRGSAAEAGAAGERWCARPWRYVSPEISLSHPPVQPQTTQSGVLYRPNVRHKIVVLRKSDPGRRGSQGWRPFQTKLVDMPNVSPLLSFGVDRATFLARKTTLEFADGVLTDVTVEKSRAPADAVSIPLVIARKIVAVPPEIFKLKISDIDNKAALLNAEKELLKAQKQYLDSTAPKKEIPLGGAGRSTDEGSSHNPPTGARNNGTTAIYGGCKDAGGGDECQDLKAAPR